MSTEFYEGPGSSADWDLRLPGEPGYRTAEQVIAESSGDARVRPLVAADAHSPAGAADGTGGGAGGDAHERERFADTFAGGLEAGAGGASLLDQLSAEIGRKTTPTHTVPLPDHPDVELVCRLDWSEEQFRTWRAKAKDRRAEDGINNTKLVTAMLVAQTVRVVLRGTVLTDDGVPLTFKSKLLQQRFGANTPEQAVAVFIPSFPQLIAVGNEVSEAAGKGSLVDGAADPT